MNRPGHHPQRARCPGRLAGACHLDELVPETSWHDNSLDGVREDPIRLGRGDPVVGWRPMCAKAFAKAPMKPDAAASASSAMDSASASSKDVRVSGREMFIVPMPAGQMDWPGLARSSREISHQTRAR